MHEQLRTAIDLIPLIQSLTYGEASAAVTDRTAYLADVPSKRLDFKHKPGDPIKEGSGSQAAIDTGKMFRREQPSAVFGVPYIVTAVPLRDTDGAVIGSMVVRLPLHLEEEMTRMAGDLAAAMTQFSGAFRDIAAIAENTARTATTLAEATAHLHTAQKDTEVVNDSITKVTDQTRLLGLNALIESAHAGAAGRGFGVVAREIQVLAQRSLKATEDMTRSLAIVAAQNDAVTSGTQSLLADSETLHAQVEESLSIVENLAAMAQNLKALAARSDSTH
jgi:hypothetical protein